MCSALKRVLCRTAPIKVRLASRIVTHGGVSERPKERASKARVGETQPWVQIPPPPPVTYRVKREELNLQIDTRNAFVLTELVVLTSEKVVDFTCSFLRILPILNANNVWLKSSKIKRLNDF